jgi:hypothetical protein
MQLIPTFVTLVAAFASVASAKPVAVKRIAKPIEDIVVTPTIIQPAGGEEFPVGSIQTAEWDTSAIPAEAANTTGTLLLGFTDDNSEGEHLDISKYP